MVPLPAVKEDLFEDLVEQARLKVLSGQRISDAEAIALHESLSLTELGSLADLVRKRQHPGNNVTYLVDRNINYTNVCNSDCSFCAFYRHDPKDPESYVLSKEILANKIEEALELGASRILLQGGHNDDLPYDFYTDMIRWIHEKYGVQLNAFSPSEVQQMKKVSGKSYKEILSELKSVGMTGLPGGGAEMLVPEIRKKFSPKKISADEWIEVMEVAQSLDLVTTATMVIGFGETIEQRVEHLRRLRDLQDRSQAKGHSGFNLFISWNLQFNENTSVGRSRLSNQYGAGAAEYLKNIALSRIYLDNIPHHQASWPTFGGDIAQIGLNFGCDDIGSTMMEENVVSKAGAPTKNKWCMSPEELRGLIRSAGFTPVERDSSFNLLRTFN